MLVELTCTIATARFTADCWPLTVTAVGSKDWSIWIEAPAATPERFETPSMLVQAPHFTAACIRAFIDASSACWHVARKGRRGSSPKGASPAHPCLTCVLLQRLDGLASFSDDAPNHRPRALHHRGAAELRVEVHRDSRHANTSARLNIKQAIVHRGPVPATSADGQMQFGLLACKATSTKCATGFSDLWASKSSALYTGGSACTQESAQRLPPRLSRLCTSLARHAGDASFRKLRSQLRHTGHSGRSDHLLVSNALTYRPARAGCGSRHLAAYHQQRRKSTAAAMLRQSLFRHRLSAACIHYGATGSDVEGLLHENLVRRHSEPMLARSGALIMSSLGCRPAADLSCSLLSKSS